MLNEEAQPKDFQPQTEDAPKENVVDESTESSLIAAEASNVVNFILNSIEEAAATEVALTTGAEEIVGENTEENETKSNEASENKADTAEDKIKAEHTVTKPNRELKLLLELSKEANLDTNIAYKRKSLDVNKHVEHQDHKYASTPPSDGKRSMRSQNPDFVVKHQKFLSKLTSDGGSHQTSDSEDKSPKEKTQKKKEHFTIGGAIDENTRKLLKPAMALILNNKDGFCWRCHRESISLSCETCPRSYHLKCLKHSNINTDHWVCPECVTILNAENTKTRSPALKEMSLEQLCGLLKFALKRMAQCNDSEPFLRPVNETEFPEYKKYIVQAMDLTRMQQNIKDNLYGSTNAFEADAKWLLHNSIIFNSYQSKLTTIAKSLLKVCKQEMSEIENCPTCYLNANTNKNWFVEVCPKPHVLLWAKLKGFPYWPAKAMSTNPQGMVDVRFFGAHDRAWVPFKECFLYSIKDPNSHKQMKSDIIECIKELDIHIENLKKKYGEFNYAPYRTPYDPENEVHQLQLLLPMYKPAYHTSTPRKFLKIDSLLKRRTVIDRPEKRGFHTPSSEPTNGEKLENKEMEGYGTDEDMEVDGDVDTQSEGRIKTIPRQAAGSLIRVPSSDSQSSRRNSDQSTKSDVSRLSNISEKINTVDISENMEISLGNQEINIKLADTANRSNVKKTVEQQNSSSSKLKISDTLIKRLSGSNKDLEDSAMDVSDNEDNLKESDEMEKSILEGENQPSISDINKVILGTPADVIEVLKVKPHGKSPVESMKESAGDNNVEVIKKSLADSTKSRNECPTAKAVATNKLNQKDSSGNVSSTTTKANTSVNNSDDKVSDQQQSDDLLEEMYSETVDVSGAIKVAEQHVKSNEDKLLQSKTTNKRKRPDDTENSNPLQNKFIKLVDINAIKKVQNGGSPTMTVASGKSILKYRLAPKEANNNAQVQKSTTENCLPSLIEIKSEPNSDAENENEDMEAKKQYLSALNISEKVTNAPKRLERESRVKTRTDTATNKASPRPNVKNASEPMETNENKKGPLPRLIKQLPPKQRARKTFPRSAPSSSKSITKNETLKVTKIINPPLPAKTTSLESQPNNNNNNVVILTQPQSVVNTLTVLPSNQTLAYTNPILTMVQQTPFSNFLVPTSTLNPVPPLNPISDRSGTNTTASQSDSTLSLNGLLASANAILTTNPQPHTTSSTMNAITFTTATVTPISSAASTSNSTNSITLLNGQSTTSTVSGGAKQTAIEVNEEYGYLSGYIPDSISKSLAELMHRAPPKLKPRPPAPISNNYDSGMPSSAGRATSVVNSVAHKLTDYFRGMLIETLTDLGTAENADALITGLRLENEKLKHKHAEEMLEIRKNVNSILRDIQKSIIDERERVIEETKAACEMETIRRIEEAKAKQWCANCLKEAQFYCCWNTSYCDYPCQLKHWPKHMSKCTQNPNASQNDSPNMAKLVTPLILRKAAAPKQFVNKPIMTKSNKETINKGPPNTIKTSSVSMNDSSKQRSFEFKTNVQGSSPLSGKVLNFNKIKPVSMITSTSSSGVLTTPSQKFIVTQSKQKPTVHID